MSAIARWWVRPSQTVSDGLAGHANSLGLLRLLLAIAVIVSHAFPIGGFGTDPFLGFFRGQDNLGGVAVFGFFTVSGYLIAKSGARIDALAFIWHRVLRIFPAFWLVLLVGAFVVGPIAWLSMGRGIRSYLLASAGPWEYLGTNWLLIIHNYGISDVFAATTPYGRLYGSVLNGSLWTLEHEFFCYLLIGALVLVTAMRRPRLAKSLIVGLAAIMAILRIGELFLGQNWAVFIPLMSDVNRQRLVFAFMIGSVFAVFSRAIRLDDRAAIAAIVIVVVTLRTSGFELFGIPALAYVVFWLAARLPRSLHRVGATNDYSYGVYVYGFLVEQCFASVGLYREGYVPFVVCSVFVTFACAWLSWHLVEKRALALKAWGPGRGVQYWYARARHRPIAELPAMSSRGET